eukprot:TRINITY_DN15769_c2_g1_i1.p1 TRINITY_DN15769_c2_g1~~TRINITY_DN15769_c2_g1_i1.p1  ORF type:complete len:138 (-),score=27.88 TRINITY_DN15769_c2_g1_i1:109-522(-)
MAFLRMSTLLGVLCVLLQAISAQDLPLGWTLTYSLGLPTRRAVIWGGDVGRGKVAARALHLRCVLMIIIGKDPVVAEAARHELYNEKPAAGTCPPGVDPAVAWDVGSVDNASFVLHLSERYDKDLGGFPDIVWNYVT